MSAPRASSSASTSTSTSSPPRSIKGRPEGGLGQVRGELVTRPYPEGPRPRFPAAMRTPVHDAARCDASGACARACPSEAIEVQARGQGEGAVFRLDYGRCTFCRACVDACPTQALSATDLFELAVRDRRDLVLEHRAGSRAPTAPTPPTSPSASAMLTEVQERVQRLFRGSLSVRAVDAGSCNGCEVEVGALTWPSYDLERLGIHFVASPRHADALLVTGPVTVNMRLALEKTFRATPDPKLVIAVGACGISGGPFRGSPEVLNGAGSSVPVNVWVPGCPPRPEALLYGLWLALGRLEQRLERGEVPAARSGSGQKA